MFSVDISIVGYVYCFDWRSKISSDLNLTVNRAQCPPSSATYFS
jgi:hypothetical protein